MNWISVEDRLPMDLEDILFTDRYTIFKGYFVKAEPDEIYHHWNSGHDDSIDGVTHWMPLPEMPHD